MLKVLWRTLLLVALSALLLGAMAVWVKLTQHQPDPNAPLEVSVVEDILWPGQETELRIHYTGEEGIVTPSAPPPATDLVFLLDTSGSMSGILPLAERAILDFDHKVGPNGQPRRVALVEFASAARVIIPFTQDHSVLFRGLQTIGGVGGGTSFLAGLDQVLELLRGGPPATVIMLTDGEAGENPDALRRFYETVWRPKGHELFLLGIGIDPFNNPRSFLALTDDPAHYIIQGMARNAVTDMFRELAERLGNVLGRQGQLTLPLAEPLWLRSPSKQYSDSALRSLPEQTRSPHVYELGTLFQHPYEWVLPIEPKLGGILTTLSESPSLSYVDMGGDIRTLSLDAKLPKVLAITPWLLFLLLLPALLYLLGVLLEWLLRRPAPVPELGPMEPIKKYRPPPNLPLRFPADAQHIHWTPTLVLGLGGAGRQVLTHMRQICNDSLDDPATRPVLLALDVARDEVEGPRPERVPGCLEPLDKQQTFILPPESCALDEAIHQSRSPDDPAATLDLREYKNLGVDALRLHKGTNGRPPLARLALLNDFAQGNNSPLLNRLQEALTAWRTLIPARSQRQILLVANVQGGVGSGWLSDLLILLRRLVKTDEAQGKAVEILVLLLGEEVAQRERVVPLQAPTLFAELDRLASAGRQGFRHCLSSQPGAAEKWLDGIVEHRPQDSVFVLSSNPQRWSTHLYPAAADAACLLLNQRRRTEFTQVLQGLQATENQYRAQEGRELYSQLVVHNAVFPRSFFRTLLANRLSCLLTGQQILFPGLEEENGQLQLRERAVGSDSLLSQKINKTAEQWVLPGSAEQSALDALRDAALGHTATLQDLNPDNDTLHHAIHGLRLLLLDNANRLLMEEHSLGPAGLLQATRSYAQHLNALNNKQAQVLVDDCNALADQASAWIELFLGTGVRRTLDGQHASMDERGIQGFVLEAAAAWERDLKALREWGDGDSRLLVGPLANEDLADSAICVHHLDEMLQTEFLKIWLGDTEAPLARLKARCHWEVTMPALNGDPIGLNLVLRGKEPRRYLPSPEELERFKADLLAETVGVLDAENDFHILKLLQQNLDTSDSGSSRKFIAGLKGGLRGERSSLLFSLPMLPTTWDSTLGELRRTLQRTMIDTAGAAELVYSCDDNDRYRIGLLQILPLLATSPQPVLVSPLHPYERLRRDYGRQLASALDVQEVALPPATGIALGNQGRLRQFAQLYGAGQVIRRELNDLWHLNDGSRWHPLTFLPEQTLADAAAYFVTHPDLNSFPVKEAVAGSLPTDEEGDFVALLDWLLHGETTGSGA